MVCALPCCAVLVCLCRAVWCCGSLCGLVACCSALLLAALGSFWLCAVPVRHVVLCGAALCCCPFRVLCVPLCGALLGCVLLCCDVILCCRGCLCVVQLCAALLSGPIPCCGVSCCDVLSRAVWCRSFCCGIFVVGCPVSCTRAASFSVGLLCPVRLLVLCSAFLPCVVFGGTSPAVLCCAVLACLPRVPLCSVPLSFGRWLVPGVAACFSGSAGGPRCSVLPSDGVFRRRCSCPAAWRVALSLSALLWFPVVSYSPLLCLVVLCCRVVVLGSPVLFLLQLVFAFAHYLKNNCRIRKRFIF